MGSLPSIVAMISPGCEHACPAVSMTKFDFASTSRVAFHFDPAIVVLDFLDRTIPARRILSPFSHGERSEMTNTR